jgi:hypothetical protein
VTIKKKKKKKKNRYVMDSTLSRKYVTYPTICIFTYTQLKSGLPTLSDASPN